MLSFLFLDCGTAHHTGFLLHLSGHPEFEAGNHTHTSFSNTLIDFPSEGFSWRNFLPGSSGFHPQGESWDSAFKIQT